MIVKCDLHLHSCLSPCGDLSMSPSYIAEVLHERGIQVAALTDHNSALNCPAFEVACQRNGVIPLFGIEAQSTEEIHALCLFGTVQTALQFGEELYICMPDIPNNPEKMGDQVYVDENDDIIGEVEKYLVTSVSLTLNEIATRVHELGGLIIPAHVDRPAFSMTSQLGCVVDGDWDALEVVQRSESARAIGSEINTLGYPVTTSSDAHYPEHIARRPFLLDIGSDPLILSDGSVSIGTIKSGLNRLLG